MPLPRVLICVTRRLPLVLGALLLPQTAAAGDWHPCRPDEPAYQEADGLLEAINSTITRLSPAADPGPLLERINRLTGSRCLEIASGICGRPEKDPSVLALQTWWSGGGYAHLRSYLDLGKPGKLMVQLSPSVRETLGVDRFPPGHPLHPLVCPTDDDRCGAETIAWTARAHGVLGFQREREPACGRIGKRDRPPSTPEECGAYAVKGAPRLRFERFTHCLAELQRSQPALPVGRLRVPTAGWLTIASGHYHWFCGPAVRVFDLATGATIGFGGCDPMAPRGRNDRIEPGQVRIEMGRVPVGAIREAAWMLLMLDSIESFVDLEGVGAELPSGVARTLPRRRPKPIDPNKICGGTTIMSNFSSGGSYLEWKAHLAGPLEASGEFSWPGDDDNAAISHATELLRAAEAAFVPGCPRVSPPPGLFDPDKQNVRASDKAPAKVWAQALAGLQICARTRPDASAPR